MSAAAPARAALLLRAAGTCAILSLTAAAIADETIVLSGGASGSRTKIAGTIVDFLGDELVVRVDGGREQRFPAARVVDIEFQRTPEHEASDAAFARADFKTAAEQARAALAKEQRRWVRRLLQAQLVRCYRAKGDLSQAVAAFLVLVRGDPNTSYFDTIPLVWTADPPPAELAAQAKLWIVASEPAVVRLIGASLLLATDARDAAVETLQALAADKADARVASLAAAQSWRAQSGSNVDWLACHRQIEALPATLQAGPYLALARLYASANLPQQSALCALRAAWAGRADATLSPPALRLAGEQLTALGQPQEAAAVAAPFPADPSAKAAATDDDEDQQFVAALCARGLYRLAVAWCEDRLADKALPPRRTVDLVVLLSTALAANARAVASSEAAPFWDRAAQIPADFIAANTAHGFAPLAQIQLALVELARGELLCQEAGLTGDARLMESAQEHLRRAITTFGDVDRAVRDLLQQTGGPRPTANRDEERLGELPLRQLQNNLRYQWARAYVAQAESYPPASADRIAAASKARELLVPLMELDETEPLMWDARLAELCCLRLLQQFAQVPARRAELVALPLDPSHRAAVAIESIRLSLAEDKVDEAAAEAGKHKTGELGGAGDLVRLQAFLAARQQALGRDTAAVADWQARAATLVQEIAEIDGPQWAARARQATSIFARAQPAPGGSPDMVADAVALYQAGKIDEALAAYDRAREAAVAADQLDAAFELAFTAATIEHERGRHGTAATRYRAAALARPAHPRAAEAHLLAIYDLSQDLRTRKPIVFDEYAAWLDEHLNRWPRGTTAATARDWLAKVHEHAGRWEEAQAVYRGVPPDDATYPKAMAELARLSLAQLSALRSEGKSTAEVADATARSLAGRVAVADDKGAAWTPADRALALAAAEAWLLYGERGAAPAEKLLRAALAKTDGAPADWLAKSQLLLALSVAAAGRGAEARDLWQKTSPTTPADKLQMLAALKSVIEQLPEAARRELAELQLDIAIPLTDEVDKLTADQRRRLDLLTARAFERAGRRDDAIKRLAIAFEIFPKDVEVGQAYAGLLAGRDDRESLDKALGVWLLMERAAKEGSPHWFTVKLNEGQLYERLGNRDRAAKMILSIQVLHPELGGPTLKAQFLELLARCRASQ